MGGGYNLEGYAVHSLWVPMQSIVPIGESSQATDSFVTQNRIWPVVPSGHDVTREYWRLVEITGI